MEEVTLNGTRNTEALDGYAPVLDSGYVRLVDVMGSDISVANSARVSFNKRSALDENGRLLDKDSRLIKFLWDNEHTAPFRHASLTFEINAPLMVARQHWKHHVASTFVDDQNGWNEMSKRYVTEAPDFYIPGQNEWRLAPDNLKQGSGDNLENESGAELTQKLMDYIDKGMSLYEYSMGIHGLCAEQARLFLPAYSLYVKYYWTVSLHGLMNFLALRLPKDAQKEIIEYARAIRDISVEKFPVSIGLVNV